MKDLPIAQCKECAEDFRQKRNDQKFCDTACRQKWHRRVELRGGKVIEMLISWRMSRGSKKGILGEIAAMVDGWIKEDRK